MSSPGEYAIDKREIDKAKVCQGCRFGKGPHQTWCQAWNDTNEYEYSKSKDNKEALKYLYDFLNKRNPATPEVEKEAKEEFRKEIKGEFIPDAILEFQQELTELYDELKVMTPMATPDSLIFNRQAFLAWLKKFKVVCK